MVRQNYKLTNFNLFFLYRCILLLSLISSPLFFQPYICFAYSIPNVRLLAKNQAQDVCELSHCKNPSNLIIQTIIIFIVISTTKRPLLNTDLPQWLNHHMTFKSHHSPGDKTAPPKNTTSTKSEFFHTKQVLPHKELSHKIHPKLYELI